MALFGFAPAAIKPVALALTMLVAAIGILRFHTMGLLVTRDWLPFTILGIPASVLGGMINLPPDSFRLVLAAILLAAAFQMARSALKAAAIDSAAAAPSHAIAVPLGGAIGLATIFTVATARSTGLAGQGVTQLVAMGAGHSAGFVTAAGFAVVAAVVVVVLRSKS